MIPGSVFSETSDQHKIVNVMTVDHRSMWRRTQTLTYILSHQWTWATSRNATHRTPRSPSLSHDGPVASFHPLSSRTFPPSARKSALLASLAQNAKLISQLWTIASPSLSLPSTTDYEEKNRDSREHKFSRLLVPVFSSLKTLICTFFMWMGLMQTFIKNLLTSDAEVQTVDALHRTQKTAVLNTNLFFITATYMTLEENVKGLTSFFWKIVWSVNCTSNGMVTLDKHFMGKFWKPNAM